MRNEKQSIFIHSCGFSIRLDLHLACRFLFNQSFQRKFPYFRCLNVYLTKILSHTNFTISWVHEGYFGNVYTPLIECLYVVRMIHLCPMWYWDRNVDVCQVMIYHYQVCYSLGYNTFNSYVLYLWPHFITYCIRVTQNRIIFLAQVYTWSQI